MKVQKMMVSLVVAALLIVPLGGIAYADVAGNSNAPSQEELSFSPGQVPAELGALDGMTPPINALVLCMAEQKLAYHENDDVFLWNSLYYMLSLCGQMDERAELTDETLILPTEVVEDYAAALFSAYSGLPALPKEMIGRVTYDWQTDSFQLARGDAGLTETRLGQLQKQPNGQAKAEGTLVSLEDGSTLYRFTVTLEQNDSMFGYAIAGLEFV